MAAEREQGGGWTFLDLGIVRSAGIPAARLEKVLAPRSDHAQQALAISLRALRAEARRADVAEALWLNSPAFCERIERREDGGPNRIEKVDRKLYAYLQRLCTKNDTVSAFGPTAYCCLAGGGDGPPAAPARHVTLSYWACLEVARALSSGNVAPNIPLRPSEGLRAAVDLDVTAAERRLVERLQTTPMGFAALWADVEGRSALEALLRRGLIRPSLEPHPISLDPLADMIELMQGGPSPALVALHRVATALAALGRARSLRRRRAAARIVERRAAAIAPMVLRGPPPDNPDRMIFSEDVYAPGRNLELGRHSWGRIRNSLELPLRLMGARAVAKREDWRRWCRARLEREGRVGALGLTELIERLSAWDEAAPTELPLVRQFDEDLSKLVAAALLAEGARQLGSEAVEAFLEAREEPGFGFASPDLLFSCHPSRARDVIIGEVHGGATVWSFLLRFIRAEERERIADRLGLLLKGLEPRPCELMLGRRRGRSFLLDLPILAVEAAHGRGPRATAGIPLSDVMIDPGSFTPFVRQSGQPLEFLRSGWSGALADILALEIEDFPIGPAAGELTSAAGVPRIALGDALIQRAQWSFDARRLKVPLAAARPGERARAAAAVQARFELPDRLYVRFGGAKPVYVDLRSELAVEWLTRALPDAGRVTLVEAFPAPDMAWLKTESGHVTAEIRTTAFWRC